LARIISIHEYVLRDDADPAALERAFREAAARGLFSLAGLVGYRLVRGLKGVRANQYAAIWTYESRAAWERLWGTPGQPVGPDHYPPSWRVWEDEILAPFLTQHPDRIAYTTYEEITGQS